MSRATLRRIIDTAVAGAKLLAGLLAVFALNLATALLPRIPFWLAAAFVGGIALMIIILAAASPHDHEGSDDDSEA